MSTYTIFAGVNGSGKTSIYQSIYYEMNKNEKRINTDEMVAKGGLWTDNTLQVKCAKEAVRLIKHYIEEGTSFNQETTLCGKSIIKNIKIDISSIFLILGLILSIILSINGRINLISNIARTPQKKE